MEFMEFTNKKGNKILVNTSKIREIKPKEEGSIILFSDIDYIELVSESPMGQNVYHYEYLEIKESYENIKKLIQG